MSKNKKKELPNDNQVSLAMQQENNNKPRAAH